MKRVIGLFILALVVTPVFHLVVTVNARAVATVEPDTILVINSFDAMSIKARDNKKDLFRELTENLSGYLGEAIKTQTGFTPIVIPGILNKSLQPDSLVFSLLKQYRAGRAILIRSVNVYFEETGTKEETDDDGKPRTITSYDLCVKNEYSLYNNHEVLKQSVTDYCEFFTTRSVKGRFAISFGPDIVGKRKHTYAPVAKNAANYIQSILPLLKSLPDQS